MDEKERTSHCEEGVGKAEEAVAVHIGEDVRVNLLSEEGTKNKYECE